MKTCPNCKHIKPLSEFGTRIYGKYSQSWCKRCVSLNTKTTRGSIRDWLDEYKKRLSCEKCGESRHYVLVFHHVDRATKLFSIGNTKNICSSIDTLKKELAKCQCLCANCHLEVHHNERENKKPND
jgi:hypothetical protein